MHGALTPDPFDVSRPEPATALRQVSNQGHDLMSPSLSFHMAVSFPWHCSSVPEIGVKGKALELECYAIYCSPYLSVALNSNLRHKL